MPFVTLGSRQQTLDFIAEEKSRRRGLVLFSRCGCMTRIAQPAQIEAGATAGKSAKVLPKRNGGGHPSYPPPPPTQQPLTTTLSGHLPKPPDKIPGATRLGSTNALAANCEADPGVNAKSSRFQQCGCQCVFRRTAQRAHSDRASPIGKSGPNLRLETPKRKWSERQDSNLRLRGPKPRALARLSYAPITAA